MNTLEDVKKHLENLQEKNVILVFVVVVVVPLKSPCAVEAAFKEGDKVNLRFLSRGESRLQVISVTAPGARAEQILHYMQAAVAKHAGLVASGVGGKELQFKTFFYCKVCYKDLVLLLTCIF